MLKYSQKQGGSVHVFIVISLIVVLLGALGFVFWQNFVNNGSNEVSSVDTTTQTETTADTIEESTDEEVALSAGNFNGETGTFQARGYLYTKDFPEPYCETNCTMYTRAFFHVSESPSQAISSFITERKGNAFIADPAVALGCVVDGTIQATGTVSGNKIYSPEISKSLIASNESKQVAVEIGRSAVMSGSEAPMCYSHFDSVSLL